MNYKGLGDKIILALDTSDLKKAQELVKILYPRVKFFKIGLEFINTGKAPELIKYINKLGGEVFYDIKLNDIPNTVGKSAKVIAGLGVWGFTVHASSGREAIRAVVTNKGKSKVMGITVLTSYQTSKSQVMQFAKMLADEGVDGIVCSAKEVKMLKKVKEFKSLKIITPGIRPIWAGSDDQERTATPKEALELGSDHLVIGRPITHPPRGISQPRALKLIIEELKIGNK